MNYSFSEAYDFYQAAVYDRRRLADGVADAIRGRGCKAPLDCSCGAGLPALDLRERGIPIECSDADEGMLRAFRNNALARGVSGDCSQMRWRDLPAWGKQFDYVLCRGNSLIYANSWANELDEPTGPVDIENCVRSIAAVVEPGGFLHVDVSRTSALGQTTYPTVFFRGQQVSVTEAVQTLGHLRQWTQQVTIGSQTFSFTRKSAQLTPAQLECMLHRTGFAKAERLELPGERASYAVFVAQKKK